MMRREVFPVLFKVCVKVQSKDGFEDIITLFPDGIVDLAYCGMLSQESHFCEDYLLVPNYEASI